MKVMMIAAATACGRISPAVMGSEHDRRLLEKMRAATGASLMGAGTLRAGNPEMLGPGGEIIKNRIRAIVSSSGDIPTANKNLFTNGPQPLVFTGDKGKASLERSLAGRAMVMALPKGPCGLSISAAIGRLADLGVESVLVEGGAKLNYSCLKEGVVDEICLTITPYLSGDSSAPSLLEGPEPLADPFLPMQLISCEALASGEILARYSLKRG